jgi:hypothetical protein
MTKATEASSSPPLEELLSAALSHGLHMLPIEQVVNILGWRVTRGLQLFSSCLKYKDTLVMDLDIVVCEITVSFKTGNTLGNN